MTGAASNGAASEELNILTDDELRQLDVENNCDVSGTDWVCTVILFDGAYTAPGGAGVTISVNSSYPNWYYWRFDSETGPVRERNRFYAHGTQIYLDAQNTDFPLGTYGVADIANQRITWFLGGNQAESLVWDKTVAFIIISAPFSITALDTNELTLSRRYNIKFASMLPEGRELEYNVTVANITSTACDLMDNGEVLAHFVKSAPGSSATLTLTAQPTVTGTSV